MKEITEWEEVESDKFYYVFMNGEFLAMANRFNMPRNYILKEKYRIFGPIQLPTLEDVLKECGE